MMKIKVIIPITSISVNTIQHHLPSREGKKKFHLPAKGSNRHRFGVLRISYDIFIIITYYKL